MPDGYMVALKVLQIDSRFPDQHYNHASLFRIDFNGTVTQYWNYSYDKPHLLFSDNLFAIDTESQLVFLGVEDQILALDMTTGAVAKKIPLEVPNLQYFWSYDYIPEEKALYGVCTGRGEWDWCRIKLDGLFPKNKFLYTFPGTNEYGPLSDIYYMDKEHQSIWFHVGIYIV